MTTNSHGSTNDWIVHPRISYEGTSLHQRNLYYRRRKQVIRYISANRRAMNLTSEEWTVLVHMLSEAPLSFPWKYVLRGTTDYASRLFDPANSSHFRRAISGLRRKGFFNAGKVEERGVGRYAGRIVRHPVLEATPQLVQFCEDRGLDHTWETPFKEGPPLVGNLKTTVMKRSVILPPPNPELLSITEFIYDPDIQKALRVLSRTSSFQYPDDYLGG